MQKAGYSGTAATARNQLPANHISTTRYVTMKAE